MAVTAVGVFKLGVTVQECAVRLVTQGPFSMMLRSRDACLKSIPFPS